MRLEGKVAFISGGARGMGAAEARLFAKEGAKVGIGDVLEEEGRSVEAEINEAGGEALFVRLDVTSQSDWQNAVSATVGRFGKLNILVNNAGVTASGTLEDADEAEWYRIVDVCAKGTFLGTKAAIPEMRKAGGGSIVNIGSLSALVGQAGGQPVYNAAKGAVRLITKTTAVQYGKDGIRANAVHPGAIATPMTDFFRDADDSFLSTIPLRKIGQPDEVAYGVLFFASDESFYATGSDFVIDGGFTAQ